MTVLLDVEFEVSPDATPLTTGNTGYTTINDPGGTFASDSGIAPYVGSFSGFATLTASFLNLHFTVATSSVIMQGIGFQADALPTTANTSILQTQFSGSARSGMRILTDGTWQLRNGTSSVWDSVANGNGTKFQANHWYWVEHYTNNNTSKQQVKIYDDGQNLLEDSGLQTYNQGTINDVMAGTSNSNTWNIHVDRHIITDSVGVFTGPRVVNTNWTRSPSVDPAGLSDSVSTQVVNLLFSTDFEGGTPGTNFTAGSLGYANLTGTWQRDTTVQYNGAQSALLSFTSNNASATVNFATDQNIIYNGIGINFASLPTNDTGWSLVKSAAGTILGSSRISTSGQIILRDLSTSVYTSQPVITNLSNRELSWYWIEHFLDVVGLRQKTQLYDYAGNLILDTDWQDFTSNVAINNIATGMVNNCTVAVNIDRHRLAISAPTGPLINAHNFASIMFESLGLSDTLTQSFTRVKIDPLGLNDSNIVVSATHQAPTVSDDSGLVDVVTTGQNFATITVTDILGLGEPLIQSDTVIETITDSVGATDNLSITHGIITVTPIDAEGLTDSTLISRSPVLSDDTGLVDTTSLVQGVTLPLVTVSDSEGLTDSVTTSTAGKQYDDPENLTDSVTSHVFTLTPNLTDSLGLREHMVIRRNGELVGSFSKVDLVMDFLTNRGYSGTVQDMQYKYLLDIYTAEFGAPTHDITSADMQLALGYTVEELITVATDWILSPFTNPAGMSDSLSVDYAAGGGADTRQANDIEGLADSLVLASTVLQSDDTGLTDSVTTAANHIPSAITDAEGLTDSTTVASVITVPDITDNEGLTDPAPTVAQTIALTAPIMLTHGNSSVAGSSHTTGTVTSDKTPGRKLLIALSLVDGTDAPTIPDSISDAGGGTWSLVTGASAVTNNSRVHTSVWECDSNGRTSAGALTINHHFTPDGCCWQVYEQPGVQVASVLKQAVVTANAASTTPSASLGSAPTAGDIVWGVIGVNAASAQTITAGTNYTLANSTEACSSVSCQLGVEIPTSLASLNQSAGFTTSNTNAKSVIILELRP